MISNLLKSILYSSQPKVTLFDFFATLGQRLTSVETSVQRVGRGAIGETFFFDGMVIPTGALIRDGSAVPRASYPALFDVIAPQVTVGVTSGSTQVTGVPANIIALLGGAGTKTPQIPVEGVGIPVGAKIASITGTTLTLTAAATANGVSIRIFPFGNGDGNTTFNIGDGRAEFVRGLDIGKGVDVGRVQGSVQADDLKSHLHAQDALTALHGIGTVWTYSAGVNNRSTGGTTGFTGGTETRPRNIASIPCIWAY